MIDPRLTPGNLFTPQLTGGALNAYNADMQRPAPQAYQAPAAPATQQTQQLGPGSALTQALMNYGATNGMRYGTYAAGQSPWAQYQQAGG